jgi:MFS family permease
LVVLLLAYLIAFIPLIAVIAFMPEAKDIVATDIEAQKVASKNMPKEPIPRAVWGYAFYGLLVWMAMVVVQMLASTVIGERGIGDAGVASIVLSFCGVGMIVSGIILPYMVKLLKNKIFAVSGIITGVGFLPCFFAGDAVTYAIGVFLVGLGSATFFNSAQNAAGNITPVSRIPFVSGVMTSMMNLGPFFAPYFIAGSTMALTTQGNAASFLTGFALCLVLGIIGIFLPLKAILFKR